MSNIQSLGDAIRLFKKFRIHFFGEKSREYKEGLDFLAGELTNRIEVDSYDNQIEQEYHRLDAGICEVLKEGDEMEKSDILAHLDRLSNPKPGDESK